VRFAEQSRWGRAVAALMLAGPASAFAEDAAAVPHPPVPAAAVAPPAAPPPDATLPGSPPPAPPPGSPTAAPPAAAIEVRLPDYPQLGFTPSFAPAESAPPAPGSCIGGACAPGSAVGFAVGESEPPGVCRVGQGVAYLGLAGSLATLGGSVAVTYAERGHGDRVGRGVLAFGTLGLVPLVALGSFITRRQCDVKGLPSARTLGWVSYAGASATALASWVYALDGYPPSRGLSIGIGAIGALALLPAAFDAYVASHQSRAVGLQLVLGPVTSLRVRF
jgi:hypothetical protein